MYCTVKSLYFTDSSSSFLSSVTSWSAFETASHLVQRWKTPKIWGKGTMLPILASVLSLYFPFFIYLKRTQRETGSCSPSFQDHRPDSSLAKEKINHGLYRESLISQMPLYFSLNGGLGTDRPGRGPIQIRPHSLHHQSTPLQHRSLSLHS